MEGEEGGDGGDVGNQGNLSFQDGDAIHRESAGYTGIDMEYRDYHENTRRVVSRQLVTHLHLCLACVCVLVCGVYVSACVRVDCMRIRVYIWICVCGVGVCVQAYVYKWVYWVQSQSHYIKYHTDNRVLAYRCPLNASYNSTQETSHETYVVWLQTYLCTANSTSYGREIHGVISISMSV